MKAILKLSFHRDQFSHKITNAFSIPNCIIECSTYIKKKPRWRQQCHKWSFSFLEVHVPVTDSLFRTYSLFNIGIAHCKWKMILYLLNYLTKQTPSVIYKCLIVTQMIYLCVFLFCLLIVCFVFNNFYAHYCEVNSDL